MGYQIKVYEKSNKRCPFNEWLNGLTDQKAKIAVDLRLERVKLGNLGLCRSLGGMIFELKIDVGPGYRVYFGKVGLKIILLLCAGNKQSQVKDIAKAKKYFQDFKEQRLNNE